MHVKNKFSFIALIILFVGPFVGASYLYFSGAAKSSKTVQHGQLIQPPISFSQIVTPKNTQLKKKWRMVYITTLPCETACQDMLYKMRQVRLTLGKDQRRVQRLLLTPTGQSLGIFSTVFEKEYAGTEHEQVDFKSFQSLSRVLSPGHLYLVDPLGNVFMEYPENVTPQALKTDLQRLLKISRIG